MSPKTKTDYEWKDGARVKSLDAQQVGEELERIRRQHKHIVPAAVVEAARRKDSPLHSAFEWDDTAAAKQWRLEQASYLIRHISIRIKREDNTVRSIRAFWSVTNGARGYTSLHVVMRSKPLREQVLARAWKELKEWRERYEDLEELSHVFEAMDKRDIKVT